MRQGLAMRLLVAISAWSMPVVAWLSNTGSFGPSNGEISDRYPTLIVAAGYAFAIWGLIFLLDVVYGTWQALDRTPDERLRGIRPWTAAAFMLTSAWMIVFSLQWFWLALAIIWASLVCLLFSTWQVSRTAHRIHGRWWQWLPLSLHAGWVSLAVFLNVAQVIVAFQLLPTGNMLPWTLVLLVLAVVLLFTVLVSLRGNPWYALAVVWGLAGVYVKQQASGLPGADITAWAGLGIAAVVIVTSLWQQFGAQQTPPSVRS